MVTGGDLLIECLVAQGVRAVFGMPGTQNLHIYDSLKRVGGDAIEHYLVRHEYAATAMADGYARVTGEIGVALTVPGPGASNASTGLLQAFTDCVPVLLITGQSESRHYSRDPGKMFHGLDQMRFFEPITKYCAIAREAQEIPRIIEEAFGVLRGPRPGPAMIEFPQDAMTTSVTVAVPRRVQPSRAPDPDDGDLRVAAELIEGVRRPLLFAGGAAAGAADELRALAEKLGAPVMVSRRGKGVLREDHPLALCDVRGYLAREAMAEADCTIAVGCRFTSIDTGYWSCEFPRPLVQLDPEPNEIGREYPCDVGVAGDLAQSLAGLHALVSEQPSRWTTKLQAWRERFESQPPLPLLPEIRRVLPEEGIVAVDVHGIGYSTFAEYPVYDPTTFIYPCIGVSLGHAFPAALGAKIACPERPVVCFSGDGGFLMGSYELATAVRYGINIVTVVVVDDALSAIKGAQRKQFAGRTIDTELHNPDFVALARSFGVEAERVDDPELDFEQVLRRALAAERPTFIEVPMWQRQEEVMDWVSWLRDDPLR